MGTDKKVADAVTRSREEDTTTDYTNHRDKKAGVP
jgi:hypothetical protein